MIPEVANDETRFEQWKIYAYLDKSREKKRLEELSSANIAKAEVKMKEDSSKRLEQMKKNTAWSEKVTAKGERDKRRGKKAKKRTWLKTNAGTSAQSEHAPLEDEDEDADADAEWEELAKEERVAKKRKQEDNNGFADL